MLPLLPMWFTTYRPRKPELPKTVDVIPLFRRGEGRGGGVSEPRRDKKNPRPMGPPELVV